MKPTNVASWILLCFLFISCPAVSGMHPGRYVPPHESANPDGVRREDNAELLIQHYLSLHGGQHGFQPSYSDPTVLHAARAFYSSIGREEAAERIDDFERLHRAQREAEARAARVDAAARASEAHALREATQIHYRFGRTRQRAQATQHPSEPISPPPSSPTEASPASSPERD
ncbi:hypothetical protein FA10DRAFT_133093 [Acaromyces ingoldii]|uniref:Uncharacterized protein n=1 Tax=Acaromyces ingoldii TaxID=215250 RepID=A0A316YIN1_9BASI|nr:hypothetical protein FA10DRAFT_133093 [Acaromyces ingoldii]PWN88936.1 hypothetical protein FA10DRAFT_133093 [Acaromyces ingoldii]